MNDEQRHKHRLGILTSGGDAPGMNAAIRSAVRTALEAGVEPVAIKEGFRGLVEGGSFFEPMTWDSVGGIMHKGGTVIGTARSDEFRTREGRLKAALNLIEHGINNLIVLGGDGSLTAADLLHREWPDLLEELVGRDTISRETADLYKTLSLASLGVCGASLASQPADPPTPARSHRVLRCLPL